MENKEAVIKLGYLLMKSPCYKYGRKNRDRFAERGENGNLY